jgi:hypothetical protein
MSPSDCVFDRHAVFGFDPHGRLFKRPGGIAARRGRRSAVLLRDLGLLTLRFEVGDMRLLLILDPYERSGKLGDLEFLRHDQGHRLTVEENFVIVERTERRPGRRDLVLILFVRRGERGPMLVREHVEHACDRKRIPDINVFDPALGDGG